VVVELGVLKQAIDAAVAYASLSTVPVEEAVELAVDYFRIDDPGDRKVVAHLVDRQLRIDAAHGLKEAMRS
jgi:hypothetical protein